MKKPRAAEVFLKVAGYTRPFLRHLRHQQPAGGPRCPQHRWPGFTPAKIASSGTRNGVDPTPAVNGKQVIQMEASASAYSPNSFKVQGRRAGPLGDHGYWNHRLHQRRHLQGPLHGTGRADAGEDECQGVHPEKAGRYKFSCWMGMVTGEIIVVDAENPGGTKTGSANLPSRPRARAAAESDPTAGGAPIDEQQYTSLVSHAFSRWSCTVIVH